MDVLQVQAQTSHSASSLHLLSRKTGVKSLGRFFKLLFLLLKGWLPWQT